MIAHYKKNKQEGLNIRILKKLKNDKVSGSLRLLKNIQNEIVLSLESKISGHIDYKLLIKQIRMAFQEFNVIVHFCESLLESLDEFSSEKIKNGIFQYRKEWENIDISLAFNLKEKVLKYYGRKVLLHSNSESITNAFGLLADEQIIFDIIQTESRPMFEGRLQADRLKDCGHHVTVITDALAANQIASVDFVLLGADKIYKDTFINKSGSLAIALACRHHKKPCYVMADSRKKVMDLSSNDENMLRKPDKEVWQNAPENINIINQYFEEVPHNLITEFIYE